MRSLIVVMLMLPFGAMAQTGGKFKEGFIIDRSGARYDGYLRLEPGTNGKPAQLMFREGKKGKTETYGPSYVSSFKIESDSFALIKKIIIPRQKVRDEDFAKVLAVGAGGVVYEYEYDLTKSSEHAASDFKTTTEVEKYFYQMNGKLAMLTVSNFKDMAVVFGDCQSIKTKISGKKAKLADLPSLIEEYKACKSK